MTKEALALEFKFASNDDAGAFTGLASTFGGVDRHGDTIASGAFARTLAEHKAAGTMPALLWSHDPSEPVGVIDTIEDSPDGLKITARLADTARGRDARALAKMGAIGGLSIGFRTRKASTGPDNTRILEDIELIEVSLVSTPANPGARLTSVKGASSPERADPMSANTTGAPDLAAIETKLATLASEVKAANDRADALETQMARPNVVSAVTLGSKTPEMKAFELYARKGQEALSADEVKTLRVSNNTAGGFLAPAEFAAEVIKRVSFFSEIRNFARVVTTGASEQRYPRRLTTTAATWTAETVARTDSEPTYDQVTFTPQELGTFVDVSQALLEDNAYGLEGELATDLGEAFGIAEGAAFVNGDGVGKPKGVMTAAGMLESNSGAAGGFAASNPADVLVRMMHRVIPAYRRNAAWMMNGDTLATVRTFKDGQGRYLVLDGLTAGAPTTLLGRPIIEAPEMPAVAANAFPILFGDFAGYRIVDRVEFGLLRDPYSQAANGIVRMHARKRTTGDVTDVSRFVKLKIAV